MVFVGWEWDGVTTVWWASQMIDGRITATADAGVTFGRVGSLKTI